MSDSSDYKTCEVCGNFEVCEISEPTGPISGLYVCFDKGHVFCKDCFPEFDKKIRAAANIRRILKESKEAARIYKEDVERDAEKDSDEELVENGEEVLHEYYAESGGVPKEECPMCQGLHVRDDEMLEYLLKKHKTTREKVMKEMKK